MLTTSRHGDMAVSASQGLTIYGGSMRNIHNIQASAATSLRRHVFEDMGITLEEQGRLPSQIQFTRPVFRKVRKTQPADTRH